MPETDNNQDFSSYLTRLYIPVGLYAFIAKEIIYRQPTLNEQLRYDNELVIAVNNNDADKAKTQLMKGAAVYGAVKYHQGKATDRVDDYDFVEMIPESNVNLLKTAVVNDNGSILKDLLYYGERNPLGILKQRELEKKARHLPKDQREARIKADKESYINGQKMEALEAAILLDKSKLVRTILESGINISDSIKLTTAGLSMTNDSSGNPEPYIIEAEEVKELITNQLEKERQSKLSWGEWGREMLGSNTEAGRGV